MVYSKTAVYSNFDTSLQQDNADTTEAYQLEATSTLHQSDAIIALSVFDQVALVSPIALHIPDQAKPLVDTEPTH